MVIVNTKVYKHKNFQRVHVTYMYVFIRYIYMYINACMYVYVYIYMYTYVMDIYNVIYIHIHVYIFSDSISTLSWLACYFFLGTVIKIVQQPSWQCPKKSKSDTYKGGVFLETRPQIDADFGAKLADARTAGTQMGTEV